VPTVIVFHRSGRGPGWRPQLHFAEYRADEQIAFAPSVNKAVQTRPQGEAAVLVHLVAASYEAEDVVVSAGDQMVPGSLGVPDIDRLIVPFRPARASMSALPTGPVTVRYVMGSDQFRFRTELVRGGESGDPLIGFTLPRVIETTSRRLAPRFGVHGNWRFEVRQGGPLYAARTLAILDASASGLALQMGETVASHLTGKVLTGSLKSLDGLSVPMQVRVRHIGGPNESWDGALLGCNFQNIGQRNQVRISGALRDLRHRQSARKKTSDGHDSARPPGSAGASLRLVQEQAPLQSNGNEPNGNEPSGIEPSGIEPSGNETSGIEPSGAPVDGLRSEPPTEE
jgi:hypothetical protein